MEKPKILIVDDRPANLEALERTLEDPDVEIIKATSGNEAVFKVMENDFALILMDVQMPEMDGFETVAYIRKEQKNRNIPVIFISAIYKDDFYKIKGVKAGGIDFISKPVIDDILIGKVKLFLQLHKYKESLKEYARMAEKASLAKSKFLATISHEIRTPMNTILGFSEILYHKEKDNLKKSYLTSIIESGKSLLNHIDDILDLSQVETGKLKLKYTTVSLHQVLDEIRALFGQRIDDKGLELIMDTPSDLPPALILDQTRLRQILANLVGNAIKFTDNGYIKITTRCYYPGRTHRKTVDLVISVEDTGPGIPEAQYNSIFEAFSQLKKHPYLELVGTGLGLTITKRLVNMMNGRISVKSEMGRGSLFTVTLKEIEVAPRKALDADRPNEMDFASVEFEGNTMKELYSEALREIPELLEILKTKEKQCQQLSEQMAIDKIEAFADEMKELGEKYRYPPLIRWSEKLTIAAAMFNIKKITEVLGT